MVRRKRFIPIFIALTLLVLILGMGNAQASETIFVQETGHWLKDEFLSFYKRFPDPVLLFGFPITDEIIDPLNGRTVQYFQKARFDRYTDSQGNTWVRLAPLGKLLYKTGFEQVKFEGNPAVCRTFHASGKQVCYHFLKFYDENLGMAVLGNPVSNIELKGGRYVQYFENARLEWRPENPPGKRVIVSSLGRDYFDQQIGDPDLLSPASGMNSISNPVAVEVNAFVYDPVIKPSSRQKLFIIVQDEYQKPIRGAMVSVVISYPDGRKEVFRPAITDENGISLLEFSVEFLLPEDVVEISVQADYLGRSAHTHTWFRVWW